MTDYTRLGLNKEETDTLLSMVESHITECDCESAQIIRDGIRFSRGEKEWSEKDAGPIGIGWRESLWLRETITDISQQGTLIAFGTIASAALAQDEELIKRAVFQLPVIAQGIALSLKLRETTIPLMADILSKVDPGA